MERYKLSFTIILLLLITAYLVSCDVLFDPKPKYVFFEYDVNTGEMITIEDDNQPSVGESFSDNEMIYAGDNKVMFINFIEYQKSFKLHVYDSNNRVWKEIYPPSQFSYLDFLYADYISLIDSNKIVIIFHSIFIWEYDVISNSWTDISEDVLSGIGEIPQFNTVQYIGDGKIIFIRTGSEDGSIWILDTKTYTWEDITQISDSTPDFFYAPSIIYGGDNNLLYIYMSDDEEEHQYYFVWEYDRNSYRWTEIFSDSNFSNKDYIKNKGSFDINNVGKSYAGNHNVLLFNSVVYYFYYPDYYESYNHNLEKYSKDTNDFLMIENIENHEFNNIEVRKRKYIKMSYAGDDKVLIGVYVK